MYDLNYKPEIIQVKNEGKFEQSLMDIFRANFKIKLFYFIFLNIRIYCKEVKASLTHV